MAIDPSLWDGVDDSVGGAFSPTQPADATPERTIAGTAGDVLATGLNAAVSVPEAVVGLADIPTLGRTGKFLEETVGFKPQEARKIIRENLYSDAQKAAQQRVDDAQGFVGTLGALIENPSVIATGVAESLPSMYLGGVAGRAVGAAAKLSPALTGAVGEGLVMAGSQAEGVRQQTEGGVLTPEQALLAAGTGVAGAGVGLAGGKIAGKFGLDDIDILMAGGGLSPNARGVFARVAGGGAIEAGEEATQTAAETIAENVALGRDALQNLPENIAQGAVLGGVMGGSTPGIRAAKDAVEGRIAERQFYDEFLKSGMPEFDRAAVRAARNEVLAHWESKIAAGQPLTPEDVRVALVAASAARTRADAAKETVKQNAATLEATRESDEAAAEELANIPEGAQAQEPAPKSRTAELEKLFPFGVTFEQTKEGFIARLNTGEELFSPTAEGFLTGPLAQDIRLATNTSEIQRLNADAEGTGVSFRWAATQPKKGAPQNLIVRTAFPDGSYKETQTTIAKAGDFIPEKPAAPAGSAPVVQEAPGAEPPAAPIGLPPGTGAGVDLGTNRTAPTLEQVGLTDEEANMARLQMEGFFDRAGTPAESQVRIVAQDWLDTYKGLTEAEAVDELKRVRGVPATALSQGINPGSATRQKEGRVAALRALIAQFETNRQSAVKAGQQAGPAGVNPTIEGPGVEVAAPPVTRGGRRGTVQRQGRQEAVGGTNATQEGQGGGEPQRARDDVGVQPEGQDRIVPTQVQEGSAEAGGGDRAQEGTGEVTPPAKPTPVRRKAAAPAAKPAPVAKNEVQQIAKIIKDGLDNGEARSMITDAFLDADIQDMERAERMLSEAIRVRRTTASALTEEDEAFLKELGDTVPVKKGKKGKASAREGLSVHESVLDALNNPENRADTPAELKQLVDDIFALTGLRVVAMKTLGGQVDGYYLPSDPMTVYVALDNPSPLLRSVNFVTSHEVYHALKVAMPQAQMDRLMSTLGKTPIGKEALAQLKQLHDPDGTLSAEAFAEEYQADVFAALMADPQTWATLRAQLAGKNSSLFKRIMEQIRDILDTVLGSGDPLSPTYRQIRQTRQAVMGELAAFARARGQGGTNGTAGVQLRGDGRGRASGRLEEAAASGGKTSLQRTDGTPEGDARIFRGPNAAAAIKAASAAGGTFEQFEEAITRYYGSDSEFIGMWESILTDELGTVDFEEVYRRIKAADDFELGQYHANDFFENIGGTIRAAKTTAEAIAALQDLLKLPGVAEDMRTILQDLGFASNEAGKAGTAIRKMSDAEYKEFLARLRSGKKPTGGGPGKASTRNFPPEAQASRRPTQGDEIGKASLQAWEAIQQDAARAKNISMDSVKFRGYKAVMSLMPMQSFIDMAKTILGPSFGAKLQSYYNILHDYSRARTSPVDEWMLNTGEKVTKLSAAEKNKFDEAAHKISFLRQTPWKQASESDWAQDANGVSQGIEFARTAWDAAGMREQTKTKENPNGMSFDEAYTDSVRVYKAMAPETATTYREAVRRLKGLYIDEMSAIKARVLEMGGETDETRKILRQLNVGFGQMKGAYWPLSRFGNFTISVTGSDPDTGEPLPKPILFRAFESKSDRDAALAELRKEYAADIKAGTVQVSAQLKDEYLANSNQSLRFISQLQTKMNDTARTRGFSEEQIADVNRSLAELWLHWQPEGSALRNLVTRKNVAGYHEDALRSGTAYMVSHSNRIANLRHSHRLEAALVNLERDARAVGQTGDPDFAVWTVGDLRKRFDATKTERVSGIVSRLSQVSSVYFMSSPSTTLVQMTQPYAVTLPSLAAKFGMGRSLSALAKANKDALSGAYNIQKLTELKDPIYAKVKPMFELITRRWDSKSVEAARGTGFRNAGVSDFMIDPKDRWKLFDPKERSKLIDNLPLSAEEKTRFDVELSKEEQRMLAVRLAIHDDHINVSATNEAIDIMGGRDKSYGITKYALFFMRKGEELSRITSILASYDLNQSKGFGNAYDEAILTARETLFDFRKEAKPAFLQKGVSRLLLQFRYFQLSMLARTSLLTAQAIGAETDPKIKAQARRELAYMAGTTTALAGAVGMPILGAAMGMSDLIQNVLFALGLGDEPPEDAEVEMFNAIEKAFGRQVAIGMMHGPIAMAPVGWAASNRIGMTDVFDIAGDSPARTEGGNYIDWLATHNLGPTYNLARNFYDGSTQLAKGETMSGLQAMLPKGLKDFAKAIDTGSEGVRSADGRVLTPAEEISAGDLIMMSLGFTPESVALPKQRARVLADLNVTIQKRKSAMAQKMADAVLEGDQEEVAKVRAEILQFMQRNPAVGGVDVKGAVRDAYMDKLGIPRRRELALQQQYPGYEIQ